MPRQFIDRMAVDVDGDGEAVVMVHGLGGTANTWTPLMPVLQRHRVIRVEMPASARSGRAYVLEEGALTIERLARSVLRVCGALGVEKARLVGHSLGTIVAMHLAVLEPALVRGLALFGPLLAPPDPARSAIRDRAARARAEGMAGIADAIVQGTLASQTRAQQPVTVAMVRESLLAQDPEGYARTCEALAAAEPAAAGEVRVPVLLVTGDEDPVAPPQAVRVMATKLADAHVEVLARCGHWTPFEKPHECQALLRGFLARGR